MILIKVRSHSTEGFLFRKVICSSYFMNNQKKLIVTLLGHAKATALFAITRFKFGRHFDKFTDTTFIKLIIHLFLFFVFRKEPVSSMAFVMVAKSSSRVTCA